MTFVLVLMSFAHSGTRTNATVPADRNREKASFLPDHSFSPGQSLSEILHLQQQGQNIGEKELNRWFKEATEEGNPEAEMRLGCMYANGKGVEKDIGKAANWFRKAAEQGNAEGQLFLGFFLLTDIKGSVMLY